MIPVRSGALYALGLGALAAACVGGSALAQNDPYANGYPGQGSSAQAYDPQGMAQPGYDQGGYGQDQGYQGQGYQGQSGYQGQDAYRGGYPAPNARADQPGGGYQAQNNGYPTPAPGYDDRGGWRGPGGDNPPHRADAGTPRRGFYDFEGRANRLEQRIESAAITNRQRRALMGQLNAIRSEANYRAGRHDGDLRDWDREMLQSRLDQIARQLPRV